LFAFGEGCAVQECLFFGRWESCFGDNLGNFVAMKGAWQDIQKRQVEPENAWGRFPVVCSEGTSPKRGIFEKFLFFNDFKIRLAAANRHLSYCSPDGTERFDVRYQSKRIRSPTRIFWLGLGLITRE
jgi:hypothetical protein